MVQVTNTNQLGYNLQEPSRSPKKIDIRLLFFIFIVIAILVVVGVWLFYTDNSPQNVNNSSPQSVRTACYDFITNERKELANDLINIGSEKDFYNNLRKLGTREGELKEAGFVKCQLDGGLNDTEVQTIDEYQWGEGRILSCASKECEEAIKTLKDGIWKEKKEIMINKLR